jgi:hypothetical protein
MYRELEVAPDLIRAGDAASPAPCDCVCGEPAPADVDEAPAGNKSAVYIELYFEING